MSKFSSTPDARSITTGETSPAAAQPASENPVAESRHDPLNDRWTLFAPQRSERPVEYVENKEELRAMTGCPFCQGCEDQTPPARWVGRIRSEDSANESLIEIDRDPDSHREQLPWSVRVVPNKYPAVNSTSVLHLAECVRKSQPPKQSLLKRKRACGGHEVIIESPQHVRSLTQLNPIHTELVLRAYQDRLRFYRAQKVVPYISIFKNVGRDAGASLSHSHSQLLAMTQLPSQIALSVGLMRRHRATTGCCLMCDLLREERSQKERMVARDKWTIAFCPFASPLPMMIRLTSIRHQAAFEDLDEVQLKSVARMLYRTIGWIEQECPGASYNYYLNTQPLDKKDPSNSFHWSIDLFPRLTHVAGFEWSSGCLINPVLPESAAKRYRKRVQAEDLRRVSP